MNKKNNYLFLGICLLVLFTACEPFKLNAPYKDVTVVYGILNYQDSIHYVKIYKGFQPEGEDAVFIAAQNPDSIYYYDFSKNTSFIDVVLQEFEKDKRTPRKDILLDITHDFPRDSGIFCYDKDKIIYYTKEKLNKGKEYKIVITNKLTGKIVEGKTSIVENFSIKSYQTFNMTGTADQILFSKAINADDQGYEIFVNFIYFEVDKNTKQVVKIGKIVKNVCPKVADGKIEDKDGLLYKKFAKTFYADIAAQLKPDDNVIRYIGLPGNNGCCIEIEGWAAGESMVQFLQSNQPTFSFIQVNRTYTNMTSIPSDGTAFGFFSSRVKCPNTYLAVNPASQDTLIYGPKTNHLGFRPWVEYKP